jgi:hypothetical protein
VSRRSYPFKAAANAVEVSSRRLTAWHDKLASECQPCNEDASVELLREENKLLKKRLLQTEQSKPLPDMDSND